MAEDALLAFFSIVRVDCEGRVLPSPAAFLSLLRTHKAIAVLRVVDVELALCLATAAAAGGIRLIEITWNSQAPGETLALLRQRLPDCQIGAGTLLCPADLEQAVRAGAQFGFAPHSDPTMIAWAQQRRWPFVPGALTPSEIVAAWQAGASAVKLFPITAVGGAEYLRSLQGPLAAIPLVPTGGVTLENAPGLLQAGALAVGLSTDLFPRVAIAQADWAAITTRAQALVHSLGAQA